MTRTFIHPTTGEPLPVHPVADLFPMLPEEELGELADDIDARGLLQPIVLDGMGRLLDGRNRLAACELADVKPEITIYEGEDPDGYALSVNIERRHLTKGQQAMITARAERLRTEKVQRSQRELAEVSNVSRNRIMQASVVLKFAPEMADAVVAGATPLDEAYAIARRRKDDANSTESKMMQLRELAPDLADLVVEERMSLNDALAAQIGRERKQQDERRDARALLTRIIDLAYPEMAADGWIEAWADKIGPADLEMIHRTEQAGKTLLALADRMKL